MELRVLNYFLMTAREENITRAAQLLNVTQPTLSRQLMQLEEELGVQLFTRGSHSITLTDDGMLLKRRAQELVSLAEKTKLELTRAEESVAGEVSVGAGELLSVGTLAALIASFREEYPLVRFEIFSGSADSIKERMERGSLDIGLLLEPVDISKYEFLRIPQKEQWGVLVRRDSPLAEKTAVTPADLAGIPLMATNRELVRRELLNWFGDRADEMDCVVTFNLQYNAAVLAERGLGAVLCLRLESDYPGLAFVPLAPKLELGSVLAWKKQQTFSRATALFLEHAKKYIQSISDNEI